MCAFSIQCVAFERRLFVRNFFFSFFIPIEIKIIYCNFVQYYCRANELHRLFWGVYKCVLECREIDSLCFAFVMRCVLVKRHRSFSFSSFFLGKCYIENIFIELMQRASSLCSLFQCQKKNVQRFAKIFFICFFLYSCKVLRSTYWWIYDKFKVCFVHFLWRSELDDDDDDDHSKHIRKNHLCCACETSCSISCKWIRCIVFRMTFERHHNVMRFQSFNRLDQWLNVMMWSKTILVVDKYAWGISVFFLLLLHNRSPFWITSSVIYLFISYSLLIRCDSIERTRIAKTFINDVTCEA